jgi:heptaprenylglyceryl phosphate synthase
MCPELQLIVGGGIVTPELAGQRVQAGASMIVTGNLWEKTQDASLFKEFADAIHQQEKDC